MYKKETKKDNSIVLSIIIPYRNRDTIRIKNCLESLKSQTQNYFTVFLVDYGSNIKYKNGAKEVCRAYKFVHYSYCHTQFQPWNKGRALNSVIRELNTDFCFIADVDMIFHPEFVKIASDLCKQNIAYYFQVGFLPKRKKENEQVFSDFSSYRKSNREATGLSLFPVEQLQQIRGFDEFYHLWGAEDTDVHVRLRNAGYTVQFYDRNVLMLHQWHESYRSEEKKGKRKDFRIKGIARINSRHLEMAQKEGKTLANEKIWGECPSEKAIKNLEKLESIELNNEKAIIDHFLYYELNALKGCKKVRIIPKKKNIIKNSKKKLLKKDIIETYNMEEVNDRLLLHMINFYRDLPYIIRIGDNLSYIEFAIDKNPGDVS